MSLFEHSYIGYFKKPTIQAFVQSLVNLVCNFSRSRSLWMEFKKIHLQVLHQGVDSSDDEGEADFDENKGLDVGRDG